MYAECLPCTHCRRSLRLYITEMPPPTAATSRELFKWCWALKNNVNAKLGHRSIDFETLWTRYEFFGGSSALDVCDLLAYFACHTKDANPVALHKLKLCFPEVKALMRSGGIPGGEAAASTFECIVSEARLDTHDGVLFAILNIRKAVRAQCLSCTGSASETHAETLVRFTSDPRKKRRADKRLRGGKSRWPPTSPSAPPLPLSPRPRRGGMGLGYTRRASD